MRREPFLDREHSWTDGQWSGWKMRRRGYPGMPVYGYAWARFARARNEDGAAKSRELRIDVRSAFHQAMKFLAAEANPPPK